MVPGVHCPVYAGITVPQSDEAVLADLAAGKAEAFWCLWTRHETALRQLCLREMGGHQADAEDALSQVMLKAQARLPACAADIVQLEAWLRQLARNLCADLRRGSGCRTDLENDPVAEALFAPPRPAVELESETRQWIAALPPPLRESFELHVLRGIPSQKVASQLGLSPANVRKRVQLARARLRRDLRHHRQGTEEFLPTALPTPPAKPAKPTREATGRWELFAGAVVVRTVRVARPCGVEEWFHVFAAKRPFGLERKLKFLERQIQRHPHHWEMRLELADLFYLTGHWNQAVWEWRQVLPRRPALQSILKLGDTLMKLGGLEDALEVFQLARRQGFPSAATGRHLDGWIAGCQQDSARSAREFQAAAELEPENPVHWHALALARQRMGNLPAALGAIQQALQLNPDDLVALSLGHKLLVAAGNLEEAGRRALQLLKLAPLDLLTLRRLVDCRCQARLTQGAAGRETVRWLRRLCRRSLNPLAIHETLASFFQAQGKPEKALEFHRQFAEAHPQCLRSRQRYADLRAAAGLSALPPTEPGVRKLSAARPCAGACRICEPA